MYAQIAHNQGKNSTPHIEYTQVYRQRVLHIAQIKVILADKVIMCNEGLHFVGGTIIPFLRPASGRQRKSF